MPSYTPMLTATEARSKARQDRIIFDEIRSIESVVLDAIDAGAYEATVTVTTMTDVGTGIAVARLYYGTWTAVDTDRGRGTQMDAVVAYFTAIGYSIERRTNSSTNDTFLWYLAW